MNKDALDDDSFRTAVTMWRNNREEAEQKYGEIGTWCTGRVTDMSKVFEDAVDFDADIGNWNTAGVTTMRAMFRNAKNFNQDISQWSTANVKDMKNLMYGADSFMVNQDIGEWNMYSVSDTRGMFDGCEACRDQIKSPDTWCAAEWDVMITTGGLWDSCQHRRGCPSYPCDNFQNDPEGRKLPWCCSAVKDNEGCASWHWCDPTPSKCAATWSVPDIPGCLNQHGCPSEACDKEPWVFGLPWCCDADSVDSELNCDMSRWHYC